MGRTHATRIPLNPKFVAFRVLLQGPSARHDDGCSSLRVGDLLEARTQLQSLVLGLYYLTRKDDGHVEGSGVTGATTVTAWSDPGRGAARSRNTSLFRSLNALLCVPCRSKRH
jgi:hypothetical protein